MNQNQSQKYHRQGAFTLVELSVVVATVFVLMLVMLPALAGTRSNTKAARCLNNLGRLTAAWSMYAGDNSDLFPGKMVDNGIDWTSNPDNTNTLKLIDPASSYLAHYMQSPDWYKCPADTYQSPLNSGPRVLSVSANAILGNGIQPPNVFNQIPGRNYVKQFIRFTQLNKPGPANTLAILDEHPDSIDDALFIFSVGLSTGNAYWVNTPGMQHGGAATISFADGHVILKRWQDSRTTPPVNFTPLRNNSVPGSPDYTWINDRMPYQ